MQTALLWNTCGKDLEWFKYSAASYTKFAKGRWDRAACFVPTKDAPLFSDVCDQHGIGLLRCDEWPEAGFNWHQMWQCSADHLFPTADAIWHMDADCVFAAPSGPEDWMHDGKLLISYTPFASLDREFGPKMWKERVDRALGGNVTRSTMTGHPHCFYTDTYRITRELVAFQQGKPFEEYVRSCENTFPQGFCEFETLGAVAHGYFHDRYSWREVAPLPGLPGFAPHPSKGRIVEAWSHGGLDFVASDRLDGVSTPREYFKRLGLSV